MRIIGAGILIMLFIAGACFCAAPSPRVPPDARASAHFDALTATNAWLATVPGNAKARSDAYFEGGYWLILWDYLWLIAIMLLLLWSGFSARMRDVSERWLRWRFGQTWLYWVEFAAVVALLQSPLTLYESFWREREYGLMNQTFGGWFKDGLIAFVLALVFGGIAFAILMEVVRRLPRTWHLWGVVVTLLLTVFLIALAPVFVAPLFNKYTPLQDETIKQPILGMAHANGIPVSDVFEVNASKQSNRVSAFVTGFAGTERIVLNDNLLKRVSPQGIMSVMGHEMGHYVMHHILNAVLFFTIVFAVMFLVLRWALERGLLRFGARWGVRAIGDSAILPWAVLVLATFDFVATPIENTFTRTQEEEADLYGLNAARQPDGEAEVDLLLGEYRKLSPGPIEEFIFFDHPSGRRRIFDAMRWKAENLCEFEPNLTCQGQVAPTAQ